MLDQVALARAPFGGVGAQRPHNVELVIAREYWLARGDPAARIAFFDDACEVFDDVGQAAFGQHLTPEVIGLDAARILRVAGAVVPSAIERQEPAFLPGKLAAHPHLTVVDREVNGAAAGTEDELSWVTVGFVLRLGMGDGLAG